MTQLNYKKKLIEVAIPLEAINKASAREKSIRHGHPSTMHLWWARRPLAACRAVLFAQLVDDPSSHPDKFPSEEAQEQERRRLFKIIEDLVIWENSTNEEVLERARHEIRLSCDGDLPPVYDPFSGGCSIPLEAQRLGLPAYASDLNPVAVTIGKAMIELPPLFKDEKPVHPGGPEQLHYANAEGLAEDVKHYGAWMREEAIKKIGGLYPKVQLPDEYGDGDATVVAWIWSRTVPSPDPAFADMHVPITSSFLLSSKAGKEVWIEPIIDKSEKTISYKIRNGGTKDELANAKSGTKAGRGANFRCIFTNAAITMEHVRSAAKSGELKETLIAIIAEGKKGRIYISPDVSHEEIAQSATPKWKPETKLSPDRRAFTPPDYGMEVIGDLFTDRQLVALNTFSDLVHDARAKIEADAIDAGLSSKPTTLLNGGTSAKAYAEAVSIYLAFAIDRLADAGSTISTWATGGFVRFTFARQALPMTWDFAECNFLSNSTGNFSGAIDWVAKAIIGLQPRNSGSVQQQSAQTVTLPKGAVISTDPPYYDNIGYADLSDFFYVWMRRNLKEVLPDLMGTIAVPKTEELVATPYRHGGRTQAENFFLTGMTGAISELAKQSSSEFPTTIYYAFKQSEIEQEGLSSTGWATFLQAVIAAGYTIVGTWPVRTERSARTRSIGSNALATSVVLVCRKRTNKAQTITRAEFIRELKQDLPKALLGLQRANITPVDMPQASIGPGIGIFSRHKSVLESDDSPMTVKAALQIINRELDAFLTEQEGEFDADTRFAVTWFEQNGMASGHFGDADNLARARGLSVDSVKHAGIVESAAGKVRLLARDELDDDWTPAKDTHLTIWECTQYLIRALQDEGEYAAASLLRQMGPENADAARDLAYRLYDICDKKGQAKEAGAYNSLIAIWSDLTAQAATITDAQLGDSQMSML